MTKLFGNSNFKDWVFPLIGGSLYALGFPMKTIPELFVLSIIGMSFFLYSLDIESGIKGKRTRERIKITLLFSLGYCLTGYYWIPYTISEFGEIPFPINWVLGVFFSLIIAPQFFILIFSSKLIEKINHVSPKAYSLITKRGTSLIFLSFLATLFEYYTPQQFPAHLGHPWIQITPFLGLAPLFGAPVYSFISYVLAFTLCHFYRTRKVHTINLILVTILLLPSLLLPLKRDKVENRDRLRLVQANIGNFLKISAEGGSYQAIQDVIQSYFELSTADSKNPIDLIVWPETAYPHLLNADRMRKSPGYIPQIFRDTILETGSELFVGGYDYNYVTKSSFESEFNTAFHFNQAGKLKDVYHKMKLIPFGENLPFGFFNQYISKLVRNISFFAKGSQYTLFKTRNQTPFVSAICYEILFSSFIRTFLNNTQEQASFLINLTNDSWYGDTSEPHQHLALAKWRAIEFNIPIVRMTNTGITSVIYPDGKESKRLSVNTKDKLDILLESSKREKTLFQKLGFFAFFCLFLFVFRIAHLLEEKTNLML